jgi:hypothetical protein
MSAVIWEKGSNVTYCRVFRSGTSPTGPKDDNRKGHTDVLRFPREDFPILRLAPVQEVSLQSTLHTSIITATTTGSLFHRHSFSVSSSC